MDHYFAQLNQINVSEHLEKKGDFSYLSWPYAVAQLRLADPAASWDVRRFDGLPYLKTEAGYFVEVAVTVQGADQGDTTTSNKTLIEAAEQIETVVPDSDGPKEVVADKGYHSNQALVDLQAVGVRGYISEPDRGRRNWKDNPQARDAVHRNRRRIRGPRGRRLMRQRGELLERPFAHLYETGAMRRVYLRGHHNILKRILLHAAALNLGLLMRTLFGVGTPRSLQGRVAALFVALWSLVKPSETLRARVRSWYRSTIPNIAFHTSREVGRNKFPLVSSFATGC